MKVLALLCLCLLLAAPGLAQGDPFFIDDAHVYEGMARPYAQGYVPSVSGGVATVVLPLQSDVCEGDIEARFEIGDVGASPVKLKNDFHQVVKRRAYTFSGERFSAYRVAFRLGLYPSRLNGEYACAIAVTGRDRAGGALTQRFPVTLRVTDGRANDRAPDVTIERFDQGADLYVGGGGQLSMDVVNASASREARDVTVTMSDGTGDILPQGSDTLALGTLAPGARAAVRIPVNALAKGAAQPHAVEFQLNYSYGDDKAATRSEKHTVDLRQEVRLHHTEAQLPPRVTQGENVQFNLTLMNMGKGTLYNALLTFDVPHMAAGGSVLAGTIEPGKSAPATANLRVDGDYTGDTAGTLTLTWEDGYGVPYEKALPLSTVINKKAAPAPGTLNAPDPTDAAASPAPRELAAWSLAGALLLALIAKTALSAKKIRKLEERRL